MCTVLSTDLVQSTGLGPMVQVQFTGLGNTGHINMVQWYYWFKIIYILPTLRCNILSSSYPNDVILVSLEREIEGFQTSPEFHDSDNWMTKCHVSKLHIIILIGFNFLQFLYIQLKICILNLLFELNKSCSPANFTYNSLIFRVDVIWVQLWKVQLW